MHKLSENNIIKLMWVPGYNNIEGSDIGDKLARDGSTSTYAGLEP